MEIDKMHWFQKSLLVLIVVLPVFKLSEVTVRAAKQQVILAQQEAKKRMVQSLPHNSIVKNKYVITCQGEVVDKQGHTVENQTLLSVSQLSGASGSEDVVLIRLEAISETAKEEIKKSDVNLPDLVYFSVQYVAESIVHLKMVVTKKLV